MSQNSYLPMLGGGQSSSSTIPSNSEVLENGFTTGKKKRRPPGTPDPDAEVVSLSPEELMESDRYVCEICNQGFQREQNLQMHRRRHKVPWKLLKREAQAQAPGDQVRKRVYVCPEPACLHHHPCHALGDLVGIKKHFRRKHTNTKHWVCDKCSKGYAVQSDYKAHIKTCGTRGHSCDCGRVFSRVESFIEHQDACKAKTIKPAVWQEPKPANHLLQTSLLNPAFSINTNLGTPPPPNSRMPKQQKTDLISPGCEDQYPIPSLHQNLKLQLLTSSNPLPNAINLSLCTTSDKGHATQLKLSVGSLSHGEKNESNSSSLNHDACKAYSMERSDIIEEPLILEVQRLKDEAREQLRMAMEEKVLAEENRRQANWEIELAKQELTDAMKIREHALMELSKAKVFKECATKQINSNILEITCNACKRKYQAITKAEVMASTLTL